MHNRYVSVYPIALSVRSSNVYEERSLGLDEEGVEEDNEEPKTKLWGSYLAWHARKQLAFGEWENNGAPPIQPKRFAP